MTRKLTCDSSKVNNAQIKECAAIDRRCAKDVFFKTKEMSHPKESGCVLSRAAHLQHTLFILDYTPVFFLCVYNTFISIDTSFDRVVTTLGEASYGWPSQCDIFKIRNVDHSNPHTKRKHTLWQIIPWAVRWFEVWIDMNHEYFSSEMTIFRIVSIFRTCQGFVIRVIRLELWIHEAWKWRASTLIDNPSRIRESIWDFGKITNLHTPVASILVRTRTTETKWQT